MAAATTSLPESPGGEPEWDYRYSWIRDSTFALWGLYTLGFDSEADGFFEFVADRCKDGSDLQVMYRLGGERDLAESILPNLTGYENRTAGEDRQWRVRSRTSTTCGVRCSTPST